VKPGLVKEVNRTVTAEVIGADEVVGCRYGEIVVRPGLLSCCTDSNETAFFGFGPGPRRKSTQMSAGVCV